MPPNSDDHGLLMRIDERTESLCGKIDEMTARMDSEFVTQAEFYPVKALVFGFVALVMLAVVGGLIALVVRGHP